MFRREVRSAECLYKRRIVLRMSRVFLSVRELLRYDFSAYTISL